MYEYEIWVDDPLEYHIDPVKRAYEVAQAFVAECRMKCGDECADSICAVSVSYDDTIKRVDCYSFTLEPKYIPHYDAIMWDLRMSDGKNASANEGLFDELVDDLTDALRIAEAMSPTWVFRDKETAHD